ncbi:hypothetical protein B0H13DRAFT_2270800 [Mycena leptocephala]|nr:hypothetical protein B0H13DRAFT_2270800 [Mycena leptocephala]
MVERRRAENLFPLNLWTTEELEACLCSQLQGCNEGGPAEIIGHIMGWSTQAVWTSRMGGPETDEEGEPRSNQECVMRKIRDSNDLAVRVRCVPCLTLYDDPENSSIEKGRGWCLATFQIEAQLGLNLNSNFDPSGDQSWEQRIARLGVAEPNRGQPKRQNISLRSVCLAALRVSQCAFPQLFCNWTFRAEHIEIAFCVDAAELLAAGQPLADV